MMAVESKQGGSQGTGSVPPTGGARRVKRSSALQKAAGALPSVETSLDEFIARANATLLDASNWDTAEKEAKAQDLERREADQLRWKAAEQQLRESEAREQSLRRQLDGLQGKLAEAEARAAVAGTTGSHDGVIADLKLRLQRADERTRAAEARSEQLSVELASRPSVSPQQLFAMGSTEDAGADDRVRIAEAKAAKAIAAAKAAAAGLNVHSEIAAIESGLVAPELAQPARKSNAAVIGFASLLVGAAVMFAVTKLVIDKDQGAAPSVPAPAAQVQPAQPQVAAPAPAPAAAPAKPVVTPIEEPAPAPQPAAAEAQPEPAPAEAKAEPAPAPKPAPKRGAAVHHAAPAAHHAAPAKAAAKPASEGTLADPFASGPAPAKKSAPKAEKKPANGSGAIVDPF
ncbi:MAG: hypothetical protein ACM31C_03150 [Acidobacteriota bacterium]